MRLSFCFVILVIFSVGVETNNEKDSRVRKLLQSLQDKATNKTQINQELTFAEKEELKDYPVCLLPPDTGPCKDISLRYFFDPASGTCVAFKYGGCEGNVNNFRTMNFCMWYCKEYSRQVVTTSYATVSAIQESQDPFDCPPIPLGVVNALCTNSCMTDRDCQSGYRCCANGCGNDCMQAVTIMKQNPMCPPPSKSGSCVDRCTDDSDCKKPSICCFNGCGKACTAPDPVIPSVPIWLEGSKKPGKRHSVASGNVPKDVPTRYKPYYLRGFEQYQPRPLADTADQPYSSLSDERHNVFSDQYSQRWSDPLVNSRKLSRYRRPTNRDSLLDHEDISEEDLVEDVEESRVRSNDPDEWDEDLDDFVWDKGGHWTVGGRGAAYNRDGLFLENLLNTEYNSEEDEEGVYDDEDRSEASLWKKLWQADLEEKELLTNTAENIKVSGLSFIEPMEVFNLMDDEEEAADGEEIDIHSKSSITRLLSPDILVNDSLSKSVVCGQPPVSGLVVCDAAFPRWTFEPSTGHCKPYLYGGCGRTANLFTSLEECNRTCNKCVLPLARGQCEEKQLRYGFSIVEGKCREFVYSGCGANANNFRTLADCENTCGS